MFIALTLLLPITSYLIIQYISANQWGTLNKNYDVVKSIDARPREGVYIFIQIRQISLTYIPASKDAFNTIVTFFQFHVF
jgi:hypothetical protein